MLNQGISAKSSSRAKNAYLERLLGSSLGSYFTPTQLENVGIGYEGLRTLLDEGLVVREGRGLYRFAEAEITEHTSLAAVCARVPRSVLCLIRRCKCMTSARDSPRVWLAIPKERQAAQSGERRAPSREILRDCLVLRRGRNFFEGVPARITNPARTVLDCFRFERLIGREAAMEALRDGLRHRKFTVDALYRAMECLPSRGLTAALEHMYTWRDYPASAKDSPQGSRRQEGRNLPIDPPPYVIERFLYRLSVSEQRDRCLLKGANLIGMWMEDPYRTTRDLDLLAERLERRTERRQARSLDLLKFPARKTELFSISKASASRRSGNRQSISGNARFSTRVSPGENPSARRHRIRGRGRARRRGLSGPSAQPAYASHLRLSEGICRGGEVRGDAHLGAPQFQDEGFP